MGRGVRFALATGLWVLTSTARARPDAPAPGELPPFFGDEDVVEVHDAPAGLVRVHFARDGRHAVDPTDGNGDGVPDVVALAGATLEEAWVFYRDGLGLREPRSDAEADANGGDGRFDLYLLRFEIGANGAFRRQSCDAEGCFGYAILESDFRRRRFRSVRDAHRIVGSHELFHAVQAAYPGELAVNVSEGTATWATERFDARLDDFEGQIAGYLARPDRALDQEPTGPVDGFSYGSALFFGYLDARFPGNGLVGNLLLGTGEDSGWLPRLEVLLGDAEGVSFADEWAVFARWNLATGRRRAEGGYVNAARYPELEPRLVSLPFEDEALRVFRASTRYYRAPIVAGSESAYRIELVGDADALSTLTIIGALEDASGALRLFSAPATDRSLELSPAENAVFAHAAVANGATEGGSARPGICFGTPAQTEACVATLAPEPADMGPGPDMQATGDMGAGMPEAGGGCSASVPAEPWALVLLGAALRRRRP